MKSITNKYLRNLSKLKWFANLGPTNQILYRYLSLLSLLISSFIPISSNAQFMPEKFSSICSGEKLKTIITSSSLPLKIDSVMDDKLTMIESGGAWRSDFKHRSITNRITICVKDTNRAMQKFDYLFNLSIDTINSLNQKGSFNVVMRVSYDPASHKAYMDKSVFQFMGCHKFSIKLNGITDSALLNPSSFDAASMQTNFYIESEIIIERYYLDAYSTPIESLNHSFVGKDRLMFYWTPPSSSAPNMYELEWTYIDTAGMDPDSIRYDFNSNSSRVLLSQTSFEINTIYDAGVILYRVRRVRPDSVYFKYNKYSDWFPIGLSDKGFVSAYSSNKVFVASHEQMGKNWDYQIAFAEEGLKKEVVNYFDGSLKRRQGVTLSNSNNFTLVDESIYDYHGREVIKIIPAPTDSGTIKFYKDFNLNVSGQPYSARDFDSTDAMEDRCNGQYKAAPLGTQNGAGRYYSTDNPDKSNENAAIPDAGGYPLVQTQLMPDPTGRVASQGGIGVAHQLGSGHETKYSYGTSTQEELDKMFGSEMGVVSHYKKNSVTDPNGQVSISYIDQHGRVVATSLAGGVPGMVDTVGSYMCEEFVMNKLSKNNVPIDNSLVVRYGFSVFASHVNKIYYNLQSDKFLFGCIGLNHCYTCRYNVDMYLTDDCGNNLLQFNRIIGVHQDTSCGILEFTLVDSIDAILGSVSPNSDSVALTLTPGNYFLYKVLRVNTDSLDFAIDEVLFNDSTCYKTIDEFIEVELSKIDFNECDCDTCGLDSMTYCDSRKTLMLSDFEPLVGQFALNDELDYSDSTSILRYYGEGYFYQYVDANAYKDEYGVKDTIWIDGMPILPTELEPEDFTNYYKETWGEALLPYHPEYCQYRYCMDSLQPSLLFDEDMMAIENYDTAMFYGYLDPLKYKAEYPDIVSDPFFVNSGGTLNWRGNQMKDKLEYMDDFSQSDSNDPLSIGASSSDIWQFSKSIGYCESISDSLERAECFKNRYDDLTINNWMDDEFGRNNYWNKFKTLYFQLKQHYIEEKMNELSFSIACIPKIGTNNCPRSEYYNKVSHFVRYNNKLANVDSTPNKEDLLDSLKTYGSCEANMQHWEEALSLCENFSVHKDSILYYFKKVCQAGGSSQSSLNIIGSSEIPSSLQGNLAYKSFHEVLVHFLGSNYKNEWCNIDLINMPRAYNTNYLNEGGSEVTECLCDNLKQEIKLFKGCHSKFDSTELSIEGHLVNDFINTMVDDNLFNITDTASRTLSAYAGMADLVNRLFVPIMGGVPGNYKIKMHKDAVYGNEKSYFIYRTIPSEGCKFSFRLNPNVSNFTNIDTTKSFKMTVRSDGSINYRFYKFGGATVDVFVYNTCFNSLGKCSENLSYAEISDFTVFLNDKFNSNMTDIEVEQLVAQCGNAGLPSIVLDKKNTYYLRYGSCPEHYRNYKEAKDIYLLSFLNEMMRPNEYWRNTMTGFELGDQSKRYLNTYEPNFHCNSGKADFLVQTKDYHLYKEFVGTIHDNYWWVNAKYVVDSSLTVLGCTSSCVKVYDTIFLNNYNNDPYFVGGFWIGARCDLYKDSTCFVSFGDPFKQLGLAGRPSISQIDSLTNYRWDGSVGNYVVTAFNRSSGDSIVLTMMNQCKAQCNPLFKVKDIAVNYKDVFAIPGKGGFARLKDVTARTGFDRGYGWPFLDMLNGLTKADNLSGGAIKDIRKIQKTHLLNNYFDQLIPEAGSYYYSNELTNDSVLVGYLQDNIGASSKCSFGLRKWGSDRSFSFADLDVFKDMTADPVAIEDGMKNERLDMAGYFFAIKGGHLNSPGDTTWYDLRGWSSCWKFFEISALSGNSRVIFNLPEGLSANCGCYACTETKSFYDSLYNEYPNLYPGHPNYAQIVTNYINRKLNTSLSFTEIQTNWDECGVSFRRFTSIPESDYRLSVKNTDCVNHGDSMLYELMDDLGLSFGVTKVKDEDSSVFLLNFSGLLPTEIATIQDSIAKYFSSPYCDAFIHWKHYRSDYDMILYNLDSASTLDPDQNLSGFTIWFASVKENLFDNSSDLILSSYDDISYSEDFFATENTSNWYAKIKFRDLDEKSRTRFEDTLIAWVNSFGGFELKRSYYVPELSLHGDNLQICVVDGGDTLCTYCDSVKAYVRDYQYSTYADSLNVRLAMSPVYLEPYLKLKTGVDVQVFDGPGTCVSCANKSLYICDQPEQKLLGIVELLNRIAKLKKLNSTNYALNASFTTLLNSIKPEDIVLNSPSYSYKPNTQGGWHVMLKYNTTFSEVLFLSIDTNDFQKIFNPGIDTFKQIRPILEDGVVSGFSIEGVDSLYNSLTFNCYMNGLKAYACCELPVTMLCPRPFTREYDQYESPCKQEEVVQAVNAGTFKYYAYLDSIRNDIKIRYQTFCLTHAKEDIRIGHNQHRYHSTLYYYDQAGNLSKTVPPQGVNELALSAQRLDSLEVYRSNINRNDSFVNSNHTMSTLYRYNALNQLIWQKTPDGGESNFWYDRLGRLVLSQNANQLARSGVAQKIYSYTKFDNLGRILEVGEISNRTISQDSLISDLEYYDFWLSGSLARIQITKTFYDYPITESIDLMFVEGQRNLRGRVASICYYNAYASADTTAYTRATHYSYDIHGNVDHLVQDFPDMESLGHRYKHLAYTYDVISGKVHSVAYQAGQADQWFHRYQYDSDNRLVLAETSADSVIWDKDAEYTYYKHGPIARTILGEKAVQGVDYAYTIHGWIKGVNSNILNPSYDIGSDGYCYLRTYTARDAFGYTIGYYNDIAGSVFDGDYKSIGSTGFESGKSGSPIGTTSGNLYNGNISHMVSSVNVLLAMNGGSPLATSYRYDQLNRIKQVQTYNGIDLDSNKWDPGSFQTAWNEKFDFDANGNITGLLRYGASTVMDKLTYNYKSGNNQLVSVDDTVNATRYLSDVDNQMAGNYRYDHIGNLTHDSLEQIDSIYWNVYGKISKIQRDANSTRANLDFHYDAMGQRVLKIVKKGELEKDWLYTWYVRDAQGNIISTYTKKSYFENIGDTSLYRQINNSLISQMNTDSLANFLKEKFKGSQFDAALSDVINNRGFLEDWYTLYGGDSLLTYDSSFAQDFFQYYCDYYNDNSDRQGFFDKLWAIGQDSLISLVGKGCYNLNDLMTALLGYDGSDEILNALGAIDISRVEQIYYMSGGMPPAPSLATMIGTIRSNPDAVVANSITNWFNIYEIESVIRGLSSTLRDNGFAAYDFCNTMSHLAGCGFTDYWYGYVYDHVDEDTFKNIIYQVSESSYLTSFLLTKDIMAVNKLASLQSDILSDALREFDGLDIMSYLGYIYKRFGKNIYNQVIEDLGGNIKIIKALTLDEQHIYGSSRHGIRKPKAVLASKTYELEEIGENGELSSIGYSTDSTISWLNYRYFTRTLTKKQYELSNHLGNVLATILDRKTPVIEEEGGDTLLYYIADVSTAQYYYAFGSVIQEMKYAHVEEGDTAGYIFGFNGKEYDIETKLQDYGFRIYNNGIGKFLSVDPLTDDYPFYSPYHFAGNTPVYAIDMDGLEPIPPRVMYDPIGAFCDWIWGETPEERKKSMDYINSTMGIGPDPEGITYSNSELTFWAGVSISANSLNDYNNLTYNPFGASSRFSGSTAKTKPTPTNSSNSTKKPYYSSSSSTTKTKYGTSTSTKPVLKYTSTYSSKVNSNIAFSYGIKSAWALDKSGMYTQRGRNLQSLNSKYIYKPAGYRDLDEFHNINNFVLFDFYHFGTQHAVSFKSWGGNTWNKSLWIGYIDKISKTIGTTHKGYFIQSASLDVVVPNDAAKQKLESELDAYAKKNNVKLNITVQN